MPASTYDFAIFGSTPFAAIVAGSLARHGGKRVLRLGSKPSVQRLPRRLDLALPFASRPQTWDLLIHGESEIRALLQTIGAPDALVPKDVLIQADTEAKSAFVGHLSHLALAAGLNVKATGAKTFLRAVPFLRAERAEDKLAEWLTAAGVRSMDPHEIEIDWGASGAAALKGPDGPFEVGQIVFADDAAILDMPADLRPAALRAEELTSTLIAKTRPLPAPVQLFADRGVSLMQRDDGSVLGLVSGNTQIVERLAAAFAGPFPIRRLATGRSHHLVSVDGAPVVGRLEGSGLFIAAALGNAAAFFAPALARYLAGSSPDSEAEQLAALAPTAPRKFISEVAA